MKKNIFLLVFTSVFYCLVAQMEMIHHLECLREAEVL